MNKTAKNYYVYAGARGNNKLIDFKSIQEAKKIYDELFTKEKNKTIKVFMMKRSI